MPIFHKVLESSTIRNVNTSRAAVTPAHAADWMLARGRSAATTAEMAALLGVAPDLVRVRLRPYAQRGMWVSPARGLWMPVPPEYRLWGSPEGIEIVDTLMRHLDVPYYVGWLSAAAIYGAAHHAPQVFQVAVGRHVRDRIVGRTKFRFAIRNNVNTLPVQRRATRSGSAAVSTREVTMLDIATDISRAGGLDNAATVLVELSEDGFDSAALAELSALFPAAAGRRIGWILENVGERDGLEPLHAVITARSAAASQLSPTGPTTGNTDHRWALRLNAAVEADI